MNIFEKIQAVRVDLQKANLKMSGKNRSRGFVFFQLEDITPTINTLMDKYKMTAIPTFTKDVATLTVINLEQSSDRYEITSPMGSAMLAGCHEVQNIGAVETYQRRYLYQALFDINESDAMDGELPLPKSKEELNAKVQPTASESHESSTGKRYKEVEALIAETIYTIHDVEALIEKVSQGKLSKLEELNEEQYAYILNSIRCSRRAK